MIKTVMESIVGRRITVSEMAPHVHSFSADENKVKKITDWLINWIILSLECGKIKPYDFLPSKADLACHIGVSQGTMQNVFRQVEDKGYIESKQRIGSYIKDKKNASLEKLTSKREMAVGIVKKYISQNDYKLGDVLISSRKLAEITGISNTTLSMAISALAAEGVLKKSKKGFIITNLSFTTTEVEAKTLVEKIADLIKEYIERELNAGDKLPSNDIIAKMFKVSIKTIHDALKWLSKDGVLYTRRGRYGTIVAGKDRENYHYEKIEQKIRSYISSNCKIGDKLPSIQSFSQNYDVSSKTVKKALDNLASDGYLTFSRGRYGGTFVTDIPQTSGEAYTWLALTPDYISGMKE